MFFDTHCHTYLSKQKSETEILEEIKEKGNFYIANIGVDLKISQHCIDIAQKYDFAYATIGIHPCDIWQYDDLDDTMIKLEDLAENKKVVAVGECGLDYYWIARNDNGEILEISQKELEAKKLIQKKWFIAQIELARKLNLPVIVHNREAGNDIIDILKEVNYTNFILHCYSENLEYANNLLSFAPNCKISFSGILTFNSAKSIQEAAKNIPLKNILIETDAPYLTPTPFRGQENYPYYVENVFNKLCDLRNESFDEIEKVVWENSLSIYGI
ncbi:YchF/TatD family DNA exonuclease [Candidatus Gracilibacteria bacterium]|nr:YchF/TatD family DNA exonuclease [Candidatus Gracilibacteria bacterium]